MTAPVTKSQICWIIIRLVGIYCIFHALTTLVVLITAVFGVGSQFNDSFLSIPAATTAAFIVVGLFSILLPFAFGTYLLRAGFLAHHFLMWEPSQTTFPIGNSQPTRPKSSPQGAVDPFTTLTEKETEEFGNWLEEHPEYQSRPQVDQIALFRDAQREASSKASED